MKLYLYEFVGESVDYTMISTKDRGPVILHRSCKYVLRCAVDVDDDYVMVFTGHASGPQDEKFHGD